MSPSSEALPQTVKRNRTRITRSDTEFFFMLKTMPLAFSSSSVFAVFVRAQNLNPLSRIWLMRIPNYIIRRERRFVNPPRFPHVFPTLR